jgi:IclR family KDG regulon transcriptional repressor
MAEELYDAKQPESVAAVLKVFALLQALSENNETGISDLSVRLAMPKATVYRFLQTMMTLGYVRQEKRQRALWSDHEDVRAGHQGAAIS